MKKLLSLMLNQEYIERCEKYATGHCLKWIFGLEQCFWTFWYSDTPKSVRSQTCVQPPLLGPEKSGSLTEVPDKSKV